MRTKTISYVWAVVLIGAGLLLLARNYGLVADFGWQWWTLIFAALSLLFFASYFSAGISHWGWLFPACIFGAVAVVVPLAEGGFNSPLIGAPVLGAVGVPFAVAYALNRREHWWALIPAWVMAVLVLILAIVERVPGEVIGALVMFAVGLPFVAVYVTDRTRWWALIPAGTMCALGLVILITLRVSGEYVGALFLLMLAVPFGVVYVVTPRNWWALIPAGVMASLGLMVLLIAGGLAVTAEAAARMVGIIFLGLAVTFAILWLRRATQPTAWAIYPAAGMAVLALLAFALGTQFDLVWPVALIAAGVLMLYLTLRPRPVG